MGPDESQSESVEGATGDAPVDSAAARRQRRAGAGPRWFLIRAALLAILFAAAHVCGWRAYTSVLSGTASPDVVPALCGVLYIALYAGCVIVVPMFVIAALLLKAADVNSALRRRTDGHAEPRDGADPRRDSTNHAALRAD